MSLPFKPRTSYEAFYLFLLSCFMSIILEILIIVRRTGDLEKEDSYHSWLSVSLSSLSVAQFPLLGNRNTISFTLQDYSRAGWGNAGGKCFWRWYREANCNLETNLLLLETGDPIVALLSAEVVKGEWSFFLKSFSFYFVCWEPLGWIHLIVLHPLTHPTFSLVSLFIETQRCKALWYLVLWERQIRIKNHSWIIANFDELAPGSSSRCYL